MSKSSKHDPAKQIMESIEDTSEELETLRFQNAFLGRVVVCLLYRMGARSPQTEVRITPKDSMIVQGMGLMQAATEEGDIVMYLEGEEMGASPTDTSGRPATPAVAGAEADVSGQTVTMPPSAPLVLTEEEWRKRDQQEAQHGNRGKNEAGDGRQSGRLVQRYDFLGEPID